jgi:cell wall-associated NlpC family hydrolase/drug/metabolite transporter superfamily protein YnfA
MSRRRLQGLFLASTLVLAVLIPAVATTASAPREVARTSVMSQVRSVLSSAATSQAQSIVNAAASQVGVTYCWDGGTTAGPSHGEGDYHGEARDCVNPDTIGFDCSGLALYAVFQATGIVLPHNAADQGADYAKYGGTLITGQSNLEPGDLVYFGGGSLANAKHVGIYAGGGEMWDANTAWKPYKDGVYQRSLRLTEEGSAGLPFDGGVRYWSANGGGSIGQQLAELEGSDTTGSDRFGYSVAVSGTTAVVGAPEHAKLAGRAYVFTQTATGWAQVAELKGSDTVAPDGFGASVAVSGTTAVVGAPGHAGDGRAYVFTETDGAWKQVAELRDSNTLANDNFGLSVAISGTTAVVGAGDNNGAAGAAYVFTETAGVWKQVAELKGSDTVGGDWFGSSVAVSGTTALVAASSHAKYAGRVYVFTETTNGWEQTAELSGSDTVAGDEFGSSVAVSGTTAVVGADLHAGRLGRAYVFTETGTSWKQAAELQSPDTFPEEMFGYSVAVSGTSVVVGAPNDDGSDGCAYVFTETASVWKQVAQLKGSHTADFDWLGYSVALSGTTMVVGAAAMNGPGQAYVFEV